VHWNGARVAEASLPARLRRVRADPNAELHLRADGETPYGIFDRVLATVKRAGIERLGLIDNRRFATG
jgi:biopolymer transport protein ExbD